jgi:hypothetical protein
MAVLAACGHPPASPSPPPPPADPERVPAQLVAYMESHGWGQLHTAWHTARRWDLLPPASLAFAQSQGWARAQRQEGEPGNGVEFLAMHRMMFEMLRSQPGATPELFAGWPTPPTEPHAGVAFDPNMRVAIDRIEHHLGEFASEDALGLYIETAMRPTPGHPGDRAQDVTAGVHNYLHNRFQDRASPVDLGNPAVNLMNRRFWQLHGWIDHVWAAYRAQHGLRDDDPAYQAAMAEAMRAMSIHTKAIAEPPPPELVDALSAL